MVLSRVLIDVTPLRESPGFRRLWVGELASGVGGQMAYVGVLYQVWESTHSSVWTGAAGLAQAVPVIAFGLFAGSLVDRGDRRRFYLMAKTGQAVCALLLAVQAFAGGPAWLVLALVAAQACFVAGGGPASRAILPRLLPAEQLAAGLALNRISFQGAMLLGPALGGLVIGAAGVGVCFLVDAFTFGVALWAAAGLPRMPPAGEPTGPALPQGEPAGPALQGEPAGPALHGEPAGSGLHGEPADPALHGGTAGPGLHGVLAGVRFVAGNRAVRGALLTDLAATVLAMPVSLFTVINAERFGDDPRMLGLFLTAMAVGGVAASALSGSFTRSAPGPVMVAGSLTWRAALALFGLVPQAWAGLALLAVAGAADTVAVVSRGTVVQTHTPDAFMGRAAAAEQIVGQAGPDLGNLRGGLIAAGSSASAALVSGGLLCMAFVALIAARTPELRGSSRQTPSRLGEAQTTKQPEE